MMHRKQQSIGLPDTLMEEDSAEQWAVLDVQGSLHGCALCLDRLRPGNCGQRREVVADDRDCFVVACKHRRPSFVFLLEAEAKYVVLRTDGCKRPLQELTIEIGGDFEQK